MYLFQTGSHDIATLRCNTWFDLISIFFPLSTGAVAAAGAECILPEDDTVDSS